MDLGGHPSWFQAVKPQGRAEADTYTTGLRMESWGSRLHFWHLCCEPWNAVGQPAVLAVMWTFQPPSFVIPLPGWPQGQVWQVQRDGWLRRDLLPLEGTSAPLWRLRSHICNGRSLVPSSQRCPCLAGAQHADTVLNIVPRMTQALQAQAFSPEQGRR